MILEIFIGISLICMALCCKLGCWKGWRLYYPTILFFMFGEVLFDVLVFRAHLWKYYAPGISDSLLDLLWIFTIFPPTVLIYLRHMPQGILKKALYIASWVSAYVAVELVLHLSGHMIYYSGWNILWSVSLDTVVFISLYLHHKQPLLGWAAGAPFFITVILVFRINPF